MNKFERIIKRIISGSGTITYSELIFILKKLDYTEIKTGKTSGSRVAFYNENLNDIIRLHKPHPGNELKLYQIKLIHTHLEQKKLI